MIDHETARLAGFFTAHGIWQLSAGMPVTAMLAYERHGERQLLPFATGEHADDARHARTELIANTIGAERATAVLGGRINTSTGGTEALIIEGRDYWTGATMTMAVPFESGGAPGQLAVYEPRVVHVPDGMDQDSLTDSFLTGADEHPQGSAAWEQFLVVS